MSAELFPISASISAAWEAWARSLDAIPSNLAYTAEEMEEAMARPVPPGFVLGLRGLAERRPPVDAVVGDVMRGMNAAPSTAALPHMEVVATGCGWCMKGHDRPHQHVLGWRIRPVRSKARGMVVGWRWWGEHSAVLARAAVVPTTDEVTDWADAGLGSWGGRVQCPVPCRFHAAPLLGAGTVHP